MCPSVNREDTHATPGTHQTPLFLHHLTESLLSLSDTLENSRSLNPRPSTHEALSMIKKLEDLVTRSIQRK